jgi:hypothetical protein
VRHELIRLLSQTRAAASVVLPSTGRLIIDSLGVAAWATTAFPKRTPNATIA